MISDPLWQLARERGVTRRRFLGLLAAGGAAAVLAACFPDDRLDESSGLAKDPEPFIAHGEAGLESRLELMDGVITPNRLFFVRNNSPESPEVDPAAWRLVVEGDAVAQPLELTYEELRRLPARTLVSYLECAGNHRVMFDRLQGRGAKGTQWGTGAVGNGVWLGVALADVLTLAGITDDAVSVLLVGLDEGAPEGGFRRVVTAGKAMHPDTLLAYGLNGEVLPRDHGYPLRAFMPGWVGSTSIKWLGRIVVSREQLWTRNNTTSYVLIGDDYPPEGEADGQAVTVQSIKSALGLPWPAELGAGTHRMHGFAHSPHGDIARVEWSADGGTSWQLARLVEPQVQYGWARFEFEWEARPGEHTLTTRATDVAGNTQPDAVPFNEKGYLFNQPVPHPIRVT
ncbi:MAG: sulfite oxidase [Chloroflexi bacterium]|nr:sulfite oxidase [Chloroflexota bacterium]